MTYQLEKVVSGGQTGVDRAALDAAIGSGFETGGWIPKGRRAENGKIPDSYTTLRETDTRNYAARTAKNVLDSDATLILTLGELSGGSLLTREFAVRYEKPFLHLRLDYTANAKNLDTVLVWLEQTRCRVLNVAGPRGSSNPEMYPAARAFLANLFAAMK